MSEQNNNKRSLTFWLGTLLFTIIFGALFSVIKITVLGFIIIVVICLFAFAIVILRMWIPKGERLKKIKDIWSSFRKKFKETSICILKKIKDRYIYLNRKINVFLTSVTSSHKFQLYLVFLIIFLSIIIFFIYQYFSIKNHYENMIKEERKNNQELCDTFFEAMKKKNSTIEKLKLEIESFKHPGNVEEETYNQEDKTQTNIKILLERGKTYYIDKKYSKAKELFKKALASPEKGEEDSEDLGYCCYYLGMIFMDEKKYGASIDYSKRAYEYFKKGKSIVMEAWSAYNVGKVQSNYTGEYEDGIKWYKIALDIFIEIGYLEKEAIVRRKLGLAYEKLGDKKNALDHLNISSGIYDKLELYDKKHEVIEEIEHIERKTFLFH